MEGPSLDRPKLATISGGTLANRAIAHRGALPTGAGFGVWYRHLAVLPMNPGTCRSPALRAIAADGTGTRRPGAIPSRSRTGVCAYGCLGSGAQI